MQVLEGSIVYGFVKKLFWCYEQSTLKRFLSALAMCWKNSRTAGFFRAVAGIRGVSQYSLVVRAISRPAGYVKKILVRAGRWVDRVVLCLSDLLRKWSLGSLLCGLSGFIIAASKERNFTLAAPVFGIGYFAGRLIQNRLMIRDILFLSLTFFAGAVLLVNPEKLKTYFRNSLFYKLYLLVLG